MTETGEDDLTRATAELGDPDALFQVSRGRYLAKLWGGLILILGGILANYLWWVVGPGGFDFILAKILLFLPLSGLALFWHMYRNRGLYALVYPTGLLRLRRGEVDSFPWAEIDFIRLKVQRATDAASEHDADGNPTAYWLPAEAPTFQLWKAWLTVARADGVEAHFGPALSDYPRLAEEVQRRTFAALWPDVWGRFRAGESIAFDDFEVTAIGLRHEKKLLPWRDFKEIAVSQGKLSIKQSGRWLPWALVDVGGVPNPHVLFALVEEARRRPPKRQPHNPDADHRPGARPDE
jgi:hypothetical protein